MGVATGSDCDITRMLNRVLMTLGFEGEGLTNHKVQIIKTHWPERGGAVEFPANKAVLIVRNPIDSIYSFLNLIVAGSHENAMKIEMLEKYPDVWQRYYQ